MPEILVRQATLADKTALFDFLRQAYPERSQYKFPERWEWEFEKNPFARGTPFVRGRLPVWIALDGVRVVGQSCALVEPLVVHGQETRVGWGVDFFVLPEYRGQGLGTRLQQANDTSHEIFMSLSMAAAASRIKANIGLQPLPPVPLLMKIVRHDPESVLKTLAARTKLPEKLIRVSGIHRLGASLLTQRTACRERDFSPPEPGTLTPVEHFGPEADALWAHLSGKYAALIRRDAEYLNWKYVQQPHVQYERFVSERGYIIFRRARPPERNVGLILDVFADPADETTLRGLLGFAIQQLKAEGVTYIQAASSVPTIQRILSAWDFKPAKTVTPMIRSALPVPETGWLLGKGDHDWDQFPLA